MVGTTSSGETVAGRTLFRYSVAGTVVVVIISYASLKVADGFFSQCGKDLFSLVTGKLKTLREIQNNIGKTVDYEFSFEVREGDFAFDVIVHVPESERWMLEKNVTDVQALVNEVKHQDPAKVTRVIARLTPHPPYIRITHVIPRPAANTRDVDLA